jgi:cytosine/adenosine deaminase-related metal-dependent hydrolase
MNKPNSAVIRNSPSPGKIKPIVIYGGPLYNGNGTVYPDGAIYVADGKIMAVGDEETVFGQIPKNVDMEVYDTLGRVIFPGMINLHHRLHRSLALGSPEYLATINSPEQFHQFWWKFEQCLNDEIVQLAVFSGILKAIKSGVTTIFDLHSSPAYVHKSLENIAAAIRRAEIRAIISYEISNRNGADVFKRAIIENQTFIENSQTDPFVRGMFGLRIDDQITDKDLALIAGSIKNGGGTHIEIASSGSIKRLHRLGLLNNKTLLAAPPPITPAEQTMIETTGAVPVLSGIAPETSKNDSFLNQSEEIGIGSWMSNPGIIAALQYEFQRLSQQNIPSQQICVYLEKLLHTNARFAAQFLPGKPGILAPGNAADIVIFDYQPPTAMNSENFPAHVLIGMQNTPAKTVMTNGQFIYSDHTFLTLDEEIIIEECQKASQHLWKKFAEFQSPNTT